MHCTNNQFPVSFASLALWWIASAVVTCSTALAMAVFGCKEPICGVFLLCTMMFFTVAFAAMCVRWLCSLGPPETWGK